MPLAGVEHLADLPKLRSLDLSGNKEFAGEGLHVLRDLRVLNLSNCVALKDQHMAKIAELHSLEELRLYGCHKITDKGFNRLFAGLDQLHTLELAFCWWHQGHELRLPPNLVHLDLHESKRLVDDAIIAIRNAQVAVDRGAVKRNCDAHVLRYRQADLLADQHTQSHLPDQGVCLVEQHHAADVLHLEPHAEELLLLLLDDLALARGAALRGAGRASGPTRRISRPGVPRDGRRRRPPRGIPDRVSGIASPPTAWRHG